MATQDSRPHPTIEVNEVRITSSILFASHSWAAAKSAEYAAFHTANDRYSGNNRYSGIKSPDRFFHYSGRCLY